MKKIKEPLYVKVIKVILSGIAALVVGMVMSISIIAIVNKANPPTKKVDTISSLQTMAPIVTKAAENPDYNNNLNLTNDLNDNSNEQWHFETISTTVDIPTTSLIPTSTPEPTATPVPISVSLLNNKQGYEYSRGSRNAAVAYIQQMLIEQSYLSPAQADGIFGSKTEKAVQDFQRANGLPVTGVVDLATQFKLSESVSGFKKVNGSLYEYAGLECYGVYRFDDSLFIGIIDQYKAYQEGTFFYSDGTIYTGSFLDNKRNGAGKVWFPNGDYYSGDWFNDKMNGKGVYHFGSIDSIEQYDGEWDSGTMTGKGTYTLPDGTVIKGIWKNNQQIGWWK